MVEETNPNDLDGIVKLLQSVVDRTRQFQDGLCRDSPLAMAEVRPVDSPLQGPSQPPPPDLQDLQESRDRSVATYHANTDCFAAASPACMRAEKELQWAMTTQAKANSGLTALQKKAEDANKKRQKAVNATQLAEEALTKARR